MPTGPMAPPAKADSKQRARARRRARLAVELRSNLKKRKEQARGRALCEAPGAAEANRGRNGQEGQPDARERANAGMTGPTGEIA
ncbi:MAG TPA: hypothetical protein VH913_06505 [Hyphomicrobiaceae bacterium]|jgi:hypothetical protein